MAPMGSLVSRGLGARVIADPEATAQERLGGPADPRHGQALQAPLSSYPWEVLPGVHQPGPQGSEAQLVGSLQGLSKPAGTPDQDPFFDHQPWTHAAPVVRGVEQSRDAEASARRLAQSMAIHARGMGASVRMHTTVAAQQDTWTDFYDVEPGTSLQDPAMPGQLKVASGGWGTTDRVSSFARQNSYGFDSSHAHRRWATGSVPGNHLWMRPGGRPMIKTLAGPSRPPIGDVSPFTGQDLGRSFGVDGAVLQDSAVEYVAPPEPYLAPGYGSAPDPGPVRWW